MRSCGRAQRGPHSVGDTNSRRIGTRMGRPGSQRLAKTRLLKLVHPPVSASKVDANGEWRYTMLKRVIKCVLVVGIIAATFVTPRAEAQSANKLVAEARFENTSFEPQGSVGSCSLGSASQDLDVNNVRARLYNNGALFWKGSGHVYTVPKDGEAQSIFAAGIWLGGLDPNGEIRFAGTAYGPFEYWPGPLDEHGSPPSDCSLYDRMFKVSADDLAKLEETGTTTADIRDWPYDLGAPVVDGDGIPDNYNIAGGDRPDLIGDQMVWWVMNEAGNVKEWSFSEPIGVEVQVTGFAFDRPARLENTTFYRYRFENKGPST